MTGLRADIPGSFQEVWQYFSTSYTSHEYLMGSVYALVGGIMLWFLWRIFSNQGY